MRTEIAHQRLEARNQDWFPARRRESPVPDPNSPRSELHALVQVTLALVADRAAPDDARPPLDVTAEVVTPARTAPAEPRPSVSPEPRAVAGQRHSVGAILSRYLANSGTAQPSGRRSVYA